jgi:hypothetical protein
VHGKTTHVNVSWTAIADGRTEAATVKEEPVFGIIPEEGPKALRIGIDLATPAREATLTVVITPRLRE